MFAPKLLKSQTKAAVSSTRKVEPQATNSADRQAAAENVEIADESYGLSRDFVKVSIAQPDRPRSGTPFRLAPPRMPGAMQTKLVVGRANDPLEHEADRVADGIMHTSGPFAVAPSQPGSTRAGGTAVALASLGKTASGDEQQRRSPARGGQSNYDPQIVEQVLSSPGHSLDSKTRAFMEPRFGRDFSGVRVHVDPRAAESAKSVDALAYTVGQHIAFSAGSYAPHTAEGARLLAHELTHTVQQNRAGRSADGRASGVETVRRRRIPNSTELAATLPAGGSDLAAQEAGLIRLLHSAWSELSAANQMKVRTDAVTFGIAAPTEAILFAVLAAASREQILKFADAILSADPTAQLGDSALIDSGPRSGTADVANITELVAGADRIFNAVASGTSDADLSDVFGSSNIKKVKAKFAKARTAMHAAQAANKIVTDRSGYDREVNLGGLSGSSRISLAPQVIDNPTVAKSIAIIIHESLHAGNPEIPHVTRGVTDLGYIGSAAFTSMEEADKLDNAADYEVIAFKKLDPTAPNAFPGIKFVPAGTTVGGVITPPLSQRQAAMREASETYRGAWTTGLNLHSLFVRVLQHPAEWGTLNLGPEFGVTAGIHFSDSLPFWSKVKNMTIHQRSRISAAGGKDTKPVTEIDVAQSEGVVRKLQLGLRAVPRVESDAVNLESKATSAQAATIAKGPADEAKVLVSLVRSEKIGEITGRVERDERAVDRLAMADRSPSVSIDILSPKNPATFVD